MIAAAIATILGAAAAIAPIYDRISQWRRSQLVGQSSNRARIEREMLDSTLTTATNGTKTLLVVEMKVSIVVPFDDGRKKVAVECLQHLTVDGSKLEEQIRALPLNHD